MITIKQNLSEKEKLEISGLIDDISDPFGEFFITKDNLRLFIRENKALFFESLKKGNKIVYSEEDGIILIVGYSDNSPRKYIKVLSRNLESAERLLKVLYWNVKEDLWAKVKKENPIRRVLQNNRFRFAGNRGREVLIRKVFELVKD